MLRESYYEANIYAYMYIHINVFVYIPVCITQFALFILHTYTIHTCNNVAHIYLLICERKQHRNRKHKVSC